MGLTLAPRLKSAVPVAVTVSAGCLVPRGAEAHVKWFCAFDVAGQPKLLPAVLTADFAVAIGLTVAILLVTCSLEHSPTGATLSRALESLTEGPRAHTERLMRAVLAAFFVSLWGAGGILLTPELRTVHGFIPWLQLGIAACMIWRPTMILGALGIVTLYAMALQAYGLFHLLDYPIFLGWAAYLALTALDRDLLGLRPLDVLRWLTAITLMWASIEKWAYPQWSYPLLILHPGMDLGIDPLRYMTLAGVVEFGMAFGLIWTPLVRRSAAIVLCAIFVSAVAEFGKLDAIGHAPIIVALVAFACDGEARLGRRPTILAPVLLCAALAAFMITYYGLHAALFGTAIL